MPYFMFQRPMTLLAPQPALPPGIRAVLWRPSPRRPLAPGLAGMPFLAWSGFHFTRLFASRDYALLLLYRDGTLVHRTCLLPAHFRFPFMAAPDLQAAGLWTAPELRGQGVALAALGELLQRLEQPGRVLWYMSRMDNGPSIRLAQKAGFTPVGRVVRRKGLGLQLLGSFDLEERYAQGAVPAELAGQVRTLLP